MPAVHVPRDAGGDDSHARGEIFAIDDDDSQVQHCGHLAGGVGLPVVVYHANRALDSAVAATIRAGHGSAVLARGGSVFVAHRLLDDVRDGHPIRVHDPELDHGVDRDAGAHLLVQHRDRKGAAPAQGVGEDGQWLGQGYVVDHV